MQSHLLAQNVPMISKPRAAPAFALILAQLLAAGAPALNTIPIANGRIVATARSTQILDGSGSEVVNMFVALRHEVSFDVLNIQHLMTLPLSPLQRRIALFGMQGHDRGLCHEEFGVSGEALKKHCAQIFSVLNVRKWTELAEHGEEIGRKT